MKLRIQQNSGFTLVETVVATLIAVIVGLASLVIFSRGNVDSIAQDSVATMNANLRSATTVMEAAIESAGFGLTSAPEYAIRPFDNVTATTIDAAGFGDNPVFSFSAIPPTAAMQGSDAILTIRSNPICERLDLDVDSSLPTFPAAPLAQGATGTLIGCLPQARCLATKDAFGFDLPVGTNLTNLFSSSSILPLPFLLVGESASGSAPSSTASLAVRATAAPQIVSVATASCPGAGISIPFVVGGLQMDNRAQNFQLTSGSATTARLVFSNFFFVNQPAAGQPGSLYDIPLTYFFPGERLEDRLLASEIDSMQIAYHMLPTTATLTENTTPPNANFRFGSLVDATAPVLDGDANGFPNMETTRFVDLVVVGTSDKPDVVDFQNKGTRIAYFNDPVATSTDSYRRRASRQQMLVRNLQFFNVTTPAYP